MRIDEETREWAQAQRRAQGLPEKLEDPEAIEKIAQLFRDARRDRAHQSETAS